MMQFLYLEPYNAAESRFGGLLTRLETQTSKNPLQFAVLQELKKSIEARRSELATTIALRRDGRLAEAEKVVKTDIGKQIMGRIREQLDVIRNKRALDRQSNSL